MSDLLVPIVVLGAVAFLAMRVWRSVRAARTDSACGNGGAGGAGGDGCGCSAPGKKRSR